jgi:hypothetical protein
LDENGGKEMESNGNSKSGLLTAGGILSIVAGIFQINNGGVLIAYFLDPDLAPSWEFFPFLPGLWVEWEELYFFTYGAPIWQMIMGVLFLVLGILAVVGGISAIKRKRFGLSLAGAICALASGLLGIVAVIFVGLGKREFRAEE